MRSLVPAFEHLLDGQAETITVWHLNFRRGPHPLLVGAVTRFRR